MKTVRLLLLCALALMGTATSDAAELGATIRTNQSTYQRGDTMRVELRVYNLTNFNEPSTIYVAVEVGGTFYFYPAFSPAAQPLASLEVPRNFDTNYFELFSLAFTDPIPAVIPLTWYSVMLRSTTGDILGELSSAPVFLVTSSGTDTPTPTPTLPQDTATPTLTPTPTETTGPGTPTNTPFPTDTPKPTDSPSPTPTTGAGTPTNTPLPPTATPTPSPTPTTGSTQPNLTCYRPSAWAGSMVVSTRRGDYSGTSSIAADQNFFLHFAVINESTLPINQRVDFNLTFMGEFIASYFIDPPLGANAAVTGTNMGPFQLPAGNWSFQLVNDPANRIAESNEGDNVCSVNFTVYDPTQTTPTPTPSATPTGIPGTLPDLACFQPQGWPAAIFIHTTPGSLTRSTSVRVDQDFYISVALANYEDLNVPLPFDMNLTINDIYIGGVSFNAQFPGLTYYPLQDLGPLSLPITGQFLLEAQIDPANVIREVTEDDNTCSTVFTVTNTTRDSSSSSPNGDPLREAILDSGTIQALRDLVSGYQPRGSYQQLPR